MITFVDGPACGQALMLSRAPVLLRVVRNRQTGKWDALDQFTDRPDPDEEIHVYRLIGRPTFCFVDYRDGHGRRRGTSCQSARYRLFAAGQTDETVRRNDLWRKWCDSVQRLEQEVAQ